MIGQAAKKAAAIVVLALLVLAIVEGEPIDSYITGLKEDSPVAEVAGAEDDLRRQIEAWRVGREEPPVNARLDPVWKAVPGYNGRVVDVEASLKRMKQADRPDPSHLVFREVAPAVTLDDLGPHPIYRGNPKKPVVSFMVNVAWGNEHLDPILDTLDRYGVKTTFFLDGSWVKRFPDLAKKIAERGHEIGNHAYSHPDMSRIGSARIREEIGKTQQVIRQTLGVTPTLFAPPSGAYHEEVVSIAHREFGMRTILWTADTVDWRNPPVDVMVNRIRAKLDRGVLVLMHPTAASARGLEQMIQAALERGLTPVTVSEVLSSKRLDPP